MSRKKSVKTEVSVKTKRYDEDAWREPLESTPINDDYWWCTVTMMVETRSDHARLVSIYNEAAEEGKRKAIYMLSYHKMLTNVRSLARQDPDKCSVMQLVCHYASKSFETNGESTWLMARLIKYMIYRVKVEVVTRIWKEQELKRAIDEEYHIMQTVLDPSSSKNVQKKGETTRTLLGKANTRLRIREEEWRDITYVDDAPHGGPNLYIVLTGFHDPDLLVELIKIGVPLTCLLKIRRPGERMEHVSLDKTDEETSIDIKKKSRFLESYTVDKGDLYKFWMTLKKYLDDPKTVGAFTSVAFLTFKPPLLPDDQSFPADDLEYEQLKKDLYDRVSFIVYDLYEILRKHSNYLRSMLIQGYDVDETEEPEDNVYRTILDALPPECVTVPTLLHALLLQLEANVDDVPATDRSARHEQKVPPPKQENIVEKVEPLEKVQSIRDNVNEISWVHERLRELNRKYYLRRDENSYHEKPDDSPIELILHGDNLRLDTSHLDLNSDILKILDSREKGLTLADAVLQVFQDPRLLYTWEDYEPLPDSKFREYQCHIGNIIKYFEPGVPVDRENIVHYLHLSVFDKMIHGTPSRKTEDRVEISSDTLSIDSRRRMFSEPYTKNYTIESSRFTKSDTQIDYGQPVAAFRRCPTLFELADPKEMILPSYSENRINEEQREKLRTPKEMIIEYSDIELLPLRILLQVFYECCQYFEGFERRYFEPTDAILLCFSNDYAIGDVTERRLVSRIRTPVCLRDFVRYVLKEEMEWLGQVEEKYRLESIDRESKSTIKGVTLLEELRQRFTDEDFILPNSLKARDMQKTLPSSGKKVDYASDNSKKLAKEEEKGKAGKEKKVKTGLSEKVSLKGRKREENGIDASFLPPRQILSLKCAKKGEPHEFVGYDLGNLRVQVTEKRRIFHSADGTLVRAILEGWLYEKPDLRIDVNLHGCTLRLSEKLNDPDAESNVFHLTTEEGIVLAFSKRIRSTDYSFSRNNDWKELDFDFHASWPSGLAINLVTGDTPENPFYVRQSYISKRPEDVAREVYRKFLRNGTVLKFLEDDSVVVLRPNAGIVECTAFEDTMGEEEKNLEEDDQRVKTSKEKEVGRSGKRKKDTPSSAKQRSSVRLVKENEDEEKQRVTPPPTVTDEVMSQPDVPAGMRYASTRIKVTGYNVLDHDGRRYEVLRDLVVREYDRLLVRESSDYELGEIFTRRSDGSDMLFRSNGELIVNFTDGTRIITGYVVEEKPLICDWTREEFRRYFGSIKLFGYNDRSLLRNHNNDNGNNNNDSNHNDRKNSNNNNDYEEDYEDEEDNELWREEPSNDEDRYQDEMTRILIAESFVSVLLTCRFEHKNYASVSYDQSAVSCTLSMPADLRVSISRRGHYEVSAPGKVNLKIEPERLIFTGEMCATCAGGSTTVYNFNQRSRAILSTIFTSTDLFGNVFAVKSDGTTTYRRGKSRDRSSRKIDFNESRGDLEDWMEMSVEEEEEEEEKEEIEEEGERRRRSSYDSKTNHGKYCEEYGGLSWQRGEITKKFRIFSINRDMTAYEYHHRSVRNEEETKAVFNEEANVIHHPVSTHRSNLRRLITFVPLETGLRSKALLQSYRIPKVGPTNGDRRDFLRSTYSIPYDWLFPFGRYGRGICSDMYDMPLAETTEERRPPRTLRLRILHGFKEPDRNAIIDLQRAMACYCQYILEGNDECGKFPECGISSSSLLNNGHESWEDDIRELALGIRRSIDVASYYGILQQPEEREEKVGKSRIKVGQTSRRLAAKLKSRKSNGMQLEWYKRCMRERIILPYFENVTGFCFLLVKECLDRLFIVCVEDEEEEGEEEEEEEEEVGREE